MKPSLPALAAAAVLGATTLGAHAQSSVTVYGIIDLGGVVDSGATAGKSVRLSSGVARASRLGFKGVEDLGKGYKAGFTIETGYCADSAAGAPNFCSGNNQFMGRTAHGDLSGSFGHLSAGREYSLAYSNLGAIDPFGNGYSARVTNLLDGSAVRLNNAVQYHSPKFGGVVASAEFALGETTGNFAASRELGASVVWPAAPPTSAPRCTRRTTRTATASRAATGSWAAPTTSRWCACTPCCRSPTATRPTRRRSTCWSGWAA